jgi:hypothetical protein
MLSLLLIPGVGIRFNLSGADHSVKQRRPFPLGWVRMVVKRAAGPLPGEPDDRRRPGRLPSVAKVVNIEDMRQQAARRLPRVLFDFVDGAADDEVTKRGNVEAFRRLCFAPRAGVTALAPDLATTVLGQALALPVLLAPCGQMRLVHPDGEVGVARAAGDRGTVSVLSTASGHTLEEGA